MKCKTLVTIIGIILAIYVLIGIAFVIHIHFTKKNDENLLNSFFNQEQIKNEIENQKEELREYLK